MNGKKICGIVGFPLNKPHQFQFGRIFKKVNASMNKFEVPKKIKKFTEFMVNEDFLAQQLLCLTKFLYSKKLK